MTLEQSSFFFIGWTASLAFCFLLWFVLPSLIRRIVRRRAQKRHSTGLAAIPLAQLKSYHATAVEMLALAGQRGDVRIVQMALDQIESVTPEIDRRRALAFAGTPDTEPAETASAADAD